MMPEQSRAARGWLGWSQKELAARAGIAANTVYGFERGQRVTANNLAALRRAFEEAGIKLLFDSAGAAAGIARQDAHIVP